MTEILCFSSKIQPSVRHRTFIQLGFSKQLQVVIPTVIGRKTTLCHFPLARWKVEALDLKMSVSPCTGTKIFCLRIQPGRCLWDLKIASEQEDSPGKTDAWYWSCGFFFISWSKVLGKSSVVEGKRLYTVWSSGSSGRTEGFSFSFSSMDWSGLKDLLIIIHLAWGKPQIRQSLVKKSFFLLTKGSDTAPCLAL